MKAGYSVTTSGEGIIPAGVTKIDDGAFEHCRELEKIVIPEGVTEIGIGAFGWCRSLKSVDIPDSVTKISGAFGNCSSLESIRIPYGVTSIEGMFSGCKSLRSVELPDSVTDIGESAFNHCESLKSIDLPAGVTWISDYAFEDCRSLESIVLPDGVTLIGDYAFAGCCSLKSIVIPDSVNSLCKNAFDGCNSLREVIISDKELGTLGASVYREGCLSELVFTDGTVKICSRDFADRLLDSSAKEQLRSVFPPREICLGGRKFMYSRHSFYIGSNVLISYDCRSDDTGYVTLINGVTDKKVSPIRENREESLLTAEEREYIAGFDSHEMPDITSPEGPDAGISSVPGSTVRRLIAVYTVRFTPEKLREAIKSGVIKLPD